VEDTEIFMEGNHFEFEPGSFSSSALLPFGVELEMSSSTMMGDAAPSSQQGAIVFEGLTDRLLPSTRERVEAAHWKEIASVAKSKELGKEAVECADELRYDWKPVQYRRRCHRHIAVIISVVTAVIVTAVAILIYSIVFVVAIIVIVALHTCTNTNTLSPHIM
jgi:hypothetical protein